MGMEQKTRFVIDRSKCTHCGKCINTCSGMVIEFGPDGFPRMKEFERFKSFDLGDVEEVFVEDGYFDFIAVENNSAQINFVYDEKIEEGNFYEF